MKAKGPTGTCSRCGQKRRVEQRDGQWVALEHQRAVKGGVMRCPGSGRKVGAATVRE